MTGPCGLSVGLSLGAPGSRHMTAEPCQRFAVVQKPNRKDGQSGCPLAQGACQAVGKSSNGLWQAGRGSVWVAQNRAGATCSGWVCRVRLGVPLD
jgi:hypothetical protein